VVPSNVECLATYIHPDTDIQQTVIHFKPSVTSGLLLTVPIETPDSAIVVTLSTNSSHLDQYDAWLRIGIHNSDNKENSFYMFDATFYEFHPPCYPGETVSVDDPLALPFLNSVFCNSSSVITISSPLVLLTQFNNDFQSFLNDT